MRALAVLHECMDAGPSVSFPLTKRSEMPLDRTSGPAIALVKDGSIKFECEICGTERKEPG
jgi:hypothetical protein